MCLHSAFTGVYAVPSVEPGLTCHQVNWVEKIQRQSLRIILYDLNYKKALEATSLKTLQQRRQQICLNFGLGQLKSEDFSSWAAT